MLVAAPADAPLCLRRSALHALEHVVTSSQHRSHFFLHVNGRPHTTHSFEGKFSFFTPRVIDAPPPLLRRSSPRVVFAAPFFLANGTTTTAVRANSLLHTLRCTVRTANPLICATRARALYSLRTLLPLKTTTKRKRRRRGTFANGSRRWCKTRRESKTDQTKGGRGGRKGSRGLS